MDKTVNISMLYGCICLNLEDRSQTCVWGSDFCECFMFYQLWEQKLSRWTLPRFLNQMDIYMSAHFICLKCKVEESWPAFIPSHTHTHTQA